MSEQVTKLPAADLITGKIHEVQATYPFEVNIHIYVPLGVWYELGQDENFMPSTHTGDNYFRGFPIFKVLDTELIRLYAVNPTELK